jgi:predicted KAP-like P-loop ATPase
LAINNWNKPDIKLDDLKIIIDEPANDVPDFREHAERLSEIIAGSQPQFTVGIFGGWGTGKTTMMQMINKKLETNYSKSITTIWFDSWRYEREKYSLMIPLLRTIIILYGISLRKGFI